MSGSRNTFDDWYGPGIVLLQRLKTFVFSKYRKFESYDFEIFIA